MKTVIIGGSSGMGLAAAVHLHRMGHEIVIAGRSKEKLERAKKSFKTVECHVLDVTVERDVLRCFDAIGPFDHLVTTAANFIMGSLSQLPLNEAKLFFEGKFWGQYLAAKYAAPHLRKGGSITFFGGIAGQKPVVNFSTACAINAAIEGLTRALALELAPLRVNAIAPGTVATPVWDVLSEQEKAKEFANTAARLPVKRVGQPEDIAHAVAYLIQCGYATGTVLYVDGGERLL